MFKCCLDSTGTDASGSNEKNCKTFTSKEKKLNSY